MKRKKGFLKTAPDWVVDDDIWEKAKKQVNKEDYPDENSYWAVVTTVYKNMGGRIKGKSSHKFNRNGKIWAEFMNKLKAMKIDKQIYEVDERGFNDLMDMAGIFFDRDVLLAEFKKRVMKKSGFKKSGLKKEDLMVCYIGKENFYDFWDRLIKEGVADEETVYMKGERFYEKYGKYFNDLLLNLLL